MEFQAKWIMAAENTGDACPVFKKTWCNDKVVVKAELILTALGTYEAKLNGKRVSDYVLAPGWTHYDKRLQYQTYDITDMLAEGENELQVTVARGWASSPIPGGVENEYKARIMTTPRALLAEILDWSYDILLPQEGPEIKEMERVAAKSVITTPAGETVLDFGQEVTGYVEFTVDAKAEINYICRDGVQTWHPALTFFGFRYLKLEEFPGEVKPEQFTAIVVYSEMKQTGYLKCSNEKINRLFSNIFWGQKGNFLDVPTDCPQRDERLGCTVRKL